MRKIYFNLKYSKTWLNKNDSFLAGGWQQASQCLINENKIYSDKNKYIASKNINDIVLSGKLRLFIKELGYLLDKKNNSSYGDNWEIILGPFVYLIWDFFNYNYSLLMKIKLDGHLIVTDFNNNKVIPIKDYIDLNDSLSNIDWQEVFIVNLAKNLLIPIDHTNFKNKYNLNSFSLIDTHISFSKKTYSFSKILINHIKFIIKIFLMRNNNPHVVLVSIYSFNRLKIFLLSFLSNYSIFQTQQFPLKEDFISEVDLITRANFSNSLSQKFYDNEVLVIFSNIVSQYLPLNYFENFLGIKNAVCNLNSYAIGSVTSYSHVTSDFYKVWLCERKNKRNDFNFGIIQHGAFGLLDPFFYSNISIHEANISDVLFKWGFGGVYKKEAFVVGIFGLDKSSSSNLQTGKTVKKIFILIEEPPRGPQYLLDFIEWKKSVEDVANLTIQLKACSIECVVRLYCNDTKYLQIDILKSINPKIILDDSDSWLKTLSANSFDVILFTYFSSGYFQSISMGYPTLIFLKKEFKINPSHLDLYNDMVVNQLILKSIDSFLEILKFINFDINTWWNSDSILKVTSEIRRNFAQSSISTFKFSRLISHIFLEKK